MAPKSKNLREFKRLLGAFNLMDNRMQVSTILTLLEIALAEEEGRDCSTKDIEASLGVLSGTASRNTYYWERGHSDMVGAYEYVTVILDPRDRRRRLLRLTPRGRHFVNQLLADSGVE